MYKLRIYNSNKSVEAKNQIKQKNMLLLGQKQAHKRIQNAANGVLDK